jgi:hypothetical protein
MRIGESKLAQARERRWSRPYNALDPAVLRLEEEQAPLRRRAVRLGIILAVIFHLILFVIVFPSYYEERVLKIGSAPKVYRLKAVTFQPPPRPRVRRSVVNPKARLVPVPDATPDDPEPIRFDDQSVDVSELDFPDIGESTVIPEGPLGPSIGPMQIGGNVLERDRRQGPQGSPVGAYGSRSRRCFVLALQTGDAGGRTGGRVLPRNRQFLGPVALSLAVTTY